MTDYYIKKDGDGNAVLWLECSVSGGNLHVNAVHPHDDVTYLYQDAACTTPYGTDPAINAGDEFNTSQTSCTVIFEPTASGGYTFKGRYKGGSTQSSPFEAEASAQDPARFDVVAVGTNPPSAFDPVIRFSNQTMIGHNVPGGRPVTISSPYLEPPVAGAHSISLEFLMLPGHPTRGVVILDSAAHAIDRWGDPAPGLANMATKYDDLVIESVDTEDLTGQGRELGRLKTKAFGDTEAYLVQGPGEDRWTLVYGSGDSRVVVPMHRPVFEID